MLVLGVQQRMPECWVAVLEGARVLAVVGLGRCRESRARLCLAGPAKFVRLKELSIAQLEQIGNDDAMPGEVRSWARRRVGEAVIAAQGCSQQPEQSQPAQMLHGGAA